MTFICRVFYELDLNLLYAILALRQKIFIVEQDCPYLDADNKDQEAHHLMGFDKHQNLVAYSRLLPKGLAYSDHVAIGRVVTAAEARGQGLGRKLMQQSIEKCKEVFGDEPIKLSAQHHLQGFYEEFGFLAIGDVYLEDGIPHIAMIRKG